MKLLLDENLSERVLAAIAPEFPGSTHVRLVGLQHADDGVGWDFAARNGFTLVSKDSDFRQRSFLYGAPPKFVWRRLGNCTTADVLAALLANAEALRRFEADETATFLALE